MRTFIFAAICLCFKCFLRSGESKKKFLVSQHRRFQGIILFCFKIEGPKYNIHKKYSIDRNSQTNAQTTHLDVFQRNETSNLDVSYVKA